MQSILLQFWKLVCRLGYGSQSNNNTISAIFSKQKQREVLKRGSVNIQE